MSSSGVWALPSPFYFRSPRSFFLQYTMFSHSLCFSRKLVVFRRVFVVFSSVCVEEDTSRVPLDDTCKCCPTNEQQPSGLCLFLVRKDWVRAQQEGYSTVDEQVVGRKRMQACQRRYHRTDDPQVHNPSFEFRSKLFQDFAMFWCRLLFFLFSFLRGKKLPLCVRPSSMIKLVHQCRCCIVYSTCRDYLASKPVFSFLC